MTAVDNRVVQMNFDNAAFESKIGTTMGSLDKLKSGLDFSKSTGHLGDLSNAASKFSMAGMASEIENISGKFIAMSTVAITVLANITTKAFDAGLSLVKSLSLDPIMSGFHEMETNMNSIQTVLANTASKGTNLDDVNKALEQLNTYSDQTIYNFSQMAHNIGTFTAAGVNLDTSVKSIKGIANLAAISGSNADQASTAMYQLSQAISTGTVKLIDWNSVVNAGMGGEVFQKALFETGKSLKTIKGVGLDTTFEQWTKGGHSFRSSLEQGWLTSQVLTNTLQGFTGDLDAAQLKSLGYTDKQAQEMMKLGALGKAAATEVKTLTQLLGTVKEAVGSGWTKSFQLVFGDFEEAKKLFTDVNNVIGKFVSDNADARNSLLQGWKTLGGRFMLIEGLQQAFKALFSILGPIQKAFRDVFPPMTAQRLADITWHFRDLMEKLTVGNVVMEKIRLIFRGLFSAISIVGNVIKGVVGVFGDLLKTIGGNINGGGILDFFTSIGVKLIDLRHLLVEEGGLAAFFDKVSAKIAEFLSKLGGYVDNVKQLIGYFVDGFTSMGTNEGTGIFLFANRVGMVLHDIVDAVGYFVDGFTGMATNEGTGVFLFANHVGMAFKAIKDFIVGLFTDIPSAIDSIDVPLNRVSQRFDGLAESAKKLGGVWDWLKNATASAGNALEPIFNAIRDWFKDLGKRLAAEMAPGDFNAVTDALNVGLLGGIALLLAKFLKGGIKFDLGDGLFKKVGKMFDTLTAKTKAMTLEIKSDALLKIAAAIGILTASVLVLSLIDSAALTKSLIAMSVGFGQLIGTFAIVEKLSSGVSGASQFTIIAAGMILMSTAILILAGAVAVLAALSWESMAQGLAGVAALLAILAGAMKIMPSGVEMAAQGVGLTAVAVALNLMATSMLIFAAMSWESMAKGFVGIGVGLGLIAAAMHLMPDPVTMLASGVSLVAVGVSLNLIAASMLIFATMSWTDIAKGFIGIAGGLFIIAAAMHLMPDPVTMLASSVSLMAVGVALNLIGAAMKIFGSMSWGEIGKGLIGMAASLLILAAAAHAMDGAILGAVAIGVMSISLMLLVKVLKEFAKIKMGDLAKGLLAMVAVIGVLALTALLVEPVIPMMILLGIALTAVGVGFALFGIGAQALAKAFQLIATAGKAGVDVVIYALDQILTRIPAIAEGFALAAISIGQKLLEAVPALLIILKVILIKLLDTIKEIAPELALTIIALITGVLDVLRSIFPQVVDTGIEFILKFLTGIRDNIGQVVSLVGEIIIAFINAVNEKIPDIVNAAVNLLISFLNAISERNNDIVTAGVNVIVSLINGISGNINDIVLAAVGILTAFLGAIGDGAVLIVAAGRDLIVKIIQGVGEAAGDVATAATDTIIAFLGGITANIQRIVDAGFEMIIKLINGISDSIDAHADELRAAGKRLVMSIISGITGGILEQKAGIGKAIIGLTDNVKQAANGALGVGSPSKWFIQYAGFLVEGLVLGFDKDKSAENSAVGLADRVINTFQESLNRIPTALESMSEFNPVITPVLDLTGVRNEARKLGSVLGPLPTLSTSLAFNQARLISAETNSRQDTLPTDNQGNTVSEIKFEQNNYSPEALSTAAIYRQTRDQIAMAKKELAIL